MTKFTVIIPASFRRVPLGPLVLLGVAVGLLQRPAVGQSRENSSVAPSSSASPAGSQQPPAPVAYDPVTEEARAEFLSGAALARKMDWSAALAAFERSARLRPHPVTTFNMAVCQRAIGQYVRARETLLLALEQNRESGGNELPETLVSQAKAFVFEIEELLVRVAVRVDPPDARIAVDGRPLKSSKVGRERLHVAGLREPGPGERAPGRSFTVLIDPGAHVFSLTARGFDNVAVNRSFAPGQREKLDLRLSRLPATLHIEANRPGAVVAVDGMDVGVAPVDISRPGGKHRVVLRKDGFVTYDTRVAVRPGEELNIRGRLSPVQESLTQQWWFWTLAGVVVTGAAATTYALTRPDPERPAPQGGTLGWVIVVE